MLDALLFPLLADHQDVTRFGHDVILQSLDNGQFPVAHRHDVVATLHEERLTVQVRVVVFVPVGDIVQRPPGTQVAPAEIRDVHVNVIGFLQYPVVDGDIPAEWEALVDELLLGRRVEQRLPLVKLSDDVREVFSKRVDDAVHVPQEDARVPYELAAINELLCQVIIGLFGECLHLVDSIFLLLTRLDVAIPRFGATRLYTQREQYRVLLHEAQPLFDIIHESPNVQDQMVGGSHHDVRVGVHSPNAKRGVGNGRGSVPPDRLQQDLLLFQLRQLPRCHLRVGIVGHDVYVLHRHNLFEPVKRALQQRPSRAKKIQELFGFPLFAKGPKAASHPTAHDHAIVIVSHSKILVLMNRYTLILFRTLKVRIKIETGPRKRVQFSLTRETSNNEGKKQNELKISFTTVIDNSL